MDMPFGRLSHWLARVYALCLWLAAFCIAAICALMLVQAATRGFGIQEIEAPGIKIRVRGIDDIVAWLSAGSAALALAAMFHRGDLVRVTLLSDALSARTRRAVEIACLGFAVVFIGYTAFAFTRFVHESWALGDMAQGLIRLPLWIPQLPMVLGIAALWLAFAEDLARVLRGAKPSYQVALDERAARKDYSETL